MFKTPNFKTEVFLRSLNIVSTILLIASCLLLKCFVLKTNQHVLKTKYKRVNGLKMNNNNKKDLGWNLVLLHLVLLLVWKWGFPDKAEIKQEFWSNVMNHPDIAQGKKRKICFLLTAVPKARSLCRSGPGCYCCCWTTWSWVRTSPFLPGLLWSESFCLDFPSHVAMIWKLLLWICMDL